MTVAPQVDRLVLDSYPLAWVNQLATDPFGGTEQPGFTLQGTDDRGNLVNGFSLGAKVTLPQTANESGNYGFIQQASLNVTMTNAGTGVHTLNTGGLVLDNNPQFRLPADHGWLGYGSWNSARVSPGQTVENIEWKSGSPVDAPAWPVFNANLMNQPDPPTEIQLQAQFVAHA